MKLYNTLTREKEAFIPREAGKVSMYTCGPTVYHFAHIGNLRTYIMEDVLEKYTIQRPGRKARDEYYRCGAPYQRCGYRRG